MARASTLFTLLPNVLQRYGHSGPASLTHIAFLTIITCCDNLSNNPLPWGVVQMMSKGLDQVCIIHTFSSLVLCLFHHPGLLHHGAAPFSQCPTWRWRFWAKILPFLSLPVKTGRRQPSRPICRSISYGESVPMGTNIKQPETSRRALECEAVQTLCKMLLISSSSHHTTNNKLLQPTYNAHASRKLTYLNTIMNRQRRHAWPSPSWKRHHQWDLRYVPT